MKAAIPLLLLPLLLTPVWAKPRPAQEARRRAEAAAALRAAEAETQEALAAYSRACFGLGLGCDRSAQPSIELVDREIVPGRDWAGKAAPGSSTIVVSIRSQDVGQTVFHELVHLAHFNLHRGESWLEDPGVGGKVLMEASAHLAALIYFPRKEGLSPAEVSFLVQDMKGALTENVDSKSWYGLVGLWTRYVFNHLWDSPGLLRKWLRWSPDGRADWLSYLDLSNEGFLGESREALPEGVKSFSGLFPYFAIATEQDGAGINRWNLFELGARRFMPPSRYLDSRWVKLDPGQEYRIGGAGFAWMRPDSLMGKPVRFSADPGVLVLLWRGKSSPPVDLLENELPASLDPWDRILMVNPELEPKTIRLSPQ